MWPVLWKIHRDVNYNGRKAMAHVADKFYHNLTRTLIELFLTYPEQYQIKRERLLIMVLLLSVFYQNHLILGNNNILILTIIDQCIEGIMAWFKYGSRQGETASDSRKCGAQ